MDANDRLKAIYKRQNAHIMDHYDRISVTVPKGTKDRIKAHGETVNGFINRLIAAELERLEAGTAATDPQQAPDHDPDVFTVPASDLEPITAKPAPTLEELQEILNAKKEERAQLPEEVKHPEPEEEEPEQEPAEPESVTDAPAISIRELAERARQTVKAEEAKREAARQKSDAENAVAEMLKNRS